MPGQKMIKKSLNELDNRDMMERFNTEWLNEPIPLELDHINGICHDNRLENLRLLCPNCHAKTSTYRGKNKNKKVLCAPLGQLVEPEDLNPFQSEFESRKEHQKIKRIRKKRERE